MITDLAALGFVFIGVVLLVLHGFLYRKRDTPATLRSYPVFGQFAEEVRRAAEGGAVIHVALGSGGLTGEQAMTSVAALEGLSAVAELAAAYDTPPVITTGDPTLYLLADDSLRRAYARLGNVGRYQQRTAVHFTAATPVAYAAMAATNLSGGDVGSNIVLGAFNQELSLLLDAGERRGVYTLGGATTPQALGALYPVLGPAHLITGEELFAGGAEATRRSGYWASLRAQDILRLLVILIILALAVLSLLGIVGG